MTGSIYPQIEPGALALMVSDLSRSVDFYQEVIGLQVWQRAGAVAVLGTSSHQLLVLQEKPGARMAPRRTGLHHFNLLLPTRAALAQSLRHLIQTRSLITAFMDHGVSEAVFLADPDGYGLALTCDRPRPMWTNFHGDLVIKLAPLDVDDLLAAADGASGDWIALPEPTRIGSVNLTVNDLDQSQAFYCDVLGFRFTGELPGVRFFSAGDAHHHISLNTWSGRGALPPPPESLRMIVFEMLFPTSVSLAVLRARMEQARMAVESWHGGWLVHDPSQNPLLLRAVG